MQEQRRTALMFAAKHRCMEIVQMLLKYKPDVHIKDSVSPMINSLGLRLLVMALFYRKTRPYLIWQRHQRFNIVSENHQ